MRRMRFIPFSTIIRLDIIIMYFILVKLNAYLNFMNRYVLSDSNGMVKRACKSKMKIPL